MCQYNSTCNLPIKQPTNPPGEIFKKGDAFRLDYPLQRNSDKTWSKSIASVHLRNLLLSRSNPKVLVMGAALTPARRTVDVQCENPEFPLWKSIPNITVHGTDYAGADANTGGSNFRFVKYLVDAHILSTVVPLNEYDAVWSNAVFEHLRYPWLVAKEVLKVLKPGGVVFVITHQTFKLHGYPYDYYRFSARALESLFEPALNAHVNASWYANQAAYVGDPNSLMFQPDPGAYTNNNESAWINVFAYVTKIDETPEYQSNYPYQVNSAET